MSGHVYVGNELSCGFTTELRLDHAPPHLVVESLAAESGFRGGGLRTGDQIIAVDGQPIERIPMERRGAESPRFPGQFQESQRWESTGRKEGDPVRLTVRRKAALQGWQAEEIQGSLRYSRNYRSEDNRVLVFEGGPDTYERDGFNDGWTSWLDQLRTQQRAIGCFGRGRPGLTTQYELRTLLEQRPRVELLVKKYPGAFAATVKSDFDAALRSVQGQLYILTPADLAYRTADEERVAKISEAARNAWDLLLAAQVSSTLPTFPAQHPIHGERDRVVGQCVVLEKLTPRQWVSEVGHGYLAAGSDSEGWYFLDMEGAGAQRMLTALRRYQRTVSNRIREEYTLLARILPEARVLVINGTGHWGLQVELLGACIGDVLFVDVQGNNPIPMFAGEASLLLSHATPPAADASPSLVLETMIHAIKADDLVLWKTLFADWLIRTNPDGSPQVCYWMQEVRDDDFERSRTSFSGRLFDARVAWVDDVRVVTTGGEYAGAPRVEEVDAELDHVGFFNGDYRSFMDVTVNRFWTLQRINGGPWRIASLQQI